MSQYCHFQKVFLSSLNLFYEGISLRKSRCKQDGTRKRLEEEQKRTQQADTGQIDQRLSVPSLARPQLAWPWRTHTWTRAGPRARFANVVLHHAHPLTPEWPDAHGFQHSPPSAAGVQPKRSHGPPRPVPPLFPSTRESRPHTNTPTHNTHMRARMALHTRAATPALAQTSVQRLYVVRAHELWQGGWRESIAQLAVCFEATWHCYTPVSQGLGKTERLLHASAETMSIETWEERGGEPDEMRGGQVDF